MSELLPYRLGKRAAKELKKIRKTDHVLYNKINVAIMSIRQNPFIGDAKKGDLKGFYCLDVMHVGVNYELCYTLEEDEHGNVVVIILMGTRENFYAELKRYLGLLRVKRINTNFIYFESRPPIRWKVGFLCLY